MPHRALLSCTYRRDGTELEYLTRGHIPAPADVRQCADLPFEQEKLAFILSKIGLHNVVFNECCKYNAHMYRVIVTDHDSPCPVCASHKHSGQNLNHSSDRMMVFINTRTETVKFSCFRINAYLASKTDGMSPLQVEQYKKANKYITLDFEGFRFFSDYDIGRGVFRLEDTEDI